MKVILLQGVAKVGQKYEIVDVTPGYARNFLIPRSLAEAITASSASRIASLKKQKEATDRQVADALAQTLGGKSPMLLEFTEKANEEGHLFAGIGKEEIVQKINALTGIGVKESMIDLEKPIKAVGKHEVMVSWGDNQKGKVLVSINAAE